MYFDGQSGGIALFINLEDAHKMPLKELEGIYAAHYNPAYYKLLSYSHLNLHFRKAAGIHLWDDGGNRYLDFTSGYGALNLGHNHPSVIEALKSHFERPNLLQVNANLFNGVVSNNIACLTDEKLPVSILTNSGTESVEEAIKLAYMYQKKGKIVYCSHAFHGKTLGAISALGDKSKYRYPVLKDSFLEVPFGDSEALEKMLKRHAVSAFLIEPVQGEGGIIVPPKGYLEQVRTLCDEYHVILILDEIQTGLGRCGSMFGYQQFDMVPDILCLAKSLSGGIIPVGCVSVKRNLWESTYGKMKNAILPNTTFGGNTFASIVAIKTLSIIREEKLCEKAKALGAYAILKLNVLRSRHEIITDVRGIGLFIGIEFGCLKTIQIKKVEEFMISNVISKLLNDYHILTVFTSNDPSVLRFEPPLIVTKEEIDYFVNSLDRLLCKEKNAFSLFINSMLNTAKGLLGSD